MNRFKDTFTSNHVILPVIHVEGLDQALRNTERAMSNGCDGVFLIAHSAPADLLLKVTSLCRREFPSFWLGVNLLDKDPWESFPLLTDEINGLWADTAFIGERSTEQPIADRISRVREKSKWEGLYFGGVAFKYQQPVTLLSKVARIAEKYMDVVTTSGPATGQPARLGKIQEMKEAITAPLAIASGITSENVSEYLPFADCFLVATGISDSWAELDPHKVKQLVEKVRGFEL